MPQLQAATPDPLPNTATQSPSGATNTERPEPGRATLPSEGAAGTTGTTPRDGLDAGQLALLLMACAFPAAVAGFLTWLSEHNGYKAVLAAGGAYVFLIPLALMIVYVLRR